MPDDTEAAALRAQVEAIIKEAEDAEAQAAATQRHVQAARLLAEEESKATALEQMATAARLHRLFDLRRHDCRWTSPSGGHNAQRPPAGEHHPRHLLHQLRLLE
jgi:hypothetical protein